MSCSERLRDAHQNHGSRRSWRVDYADWLIESERGGNLFLPFAVSSAIESWSVAHSERQTRRILRELKNPQELLCRRRYRTPVFLRIYLDHVQEERFRDPRAGLKLAKVAPQLALLVPEAPGADGRREHREQLVRAHCILGGAYRAVGRHAAAESEYETATKIADAEALSPVARADLNSCIAVLRARKDRFEEAIGLVNGAAATYRTADDRRRLAEAHMLRGYVLNEAKRYSAAIPWHGKALSLALEQQRAKPADLADVAALARVVEAARANMAWAVTHAPGCGFASTAFAHINAAHRELRGRRDSLTRHVLQWTEGKVYLRLIRPDRAEKRYKVARRGFVRLEVPWETALVSLDLAALYRADGRWKELEDLAADTFGRFRELCADFEAIGALSLWVEAVEARKGVNAAISGAREVVMARMVSP